MGNVVITFVDEHRDQRHDLVVPEEISADEFVEAMLCAYHLGSRQEDSRRFMRMEHPIGLIKGAATLKELGMRNGAVVYSGRG